MPSLPRPKPNRCAEAGGGRSPPQRLVSVRGRPGVIITHTPSKAIHMSDVFCRVVEMSIVSPVFGSANNLAGKFPNSAKLWKIPTLALHVTKIIPTTNSSNLEFNVTDRSLDFPMLVFSFYRYLPYNSATTTLFGRPNGGVPAHMEVELKCGGA
jgi:hypothetical protein